MTAAGTVTFSAKLPDDLSAAEFAALIDAIAVIDQAVVLQALSDLDNIRPVYQTWSTSERSVVRKVQYGSEFEVILGIVANFAGVAGAVAGLFVAAGKTLQLLADAGLKNEERLAKRSERLGHHEARRDAEDVVKDAGRGPIDALTDDARLELLSQARETLVPGAVSEVLYTAELSQNYGQVREAFVQLAEYGVTLRVSVPDR